MLLCGPAISNRRISSSLFAREKIHRKHEETAEHTGRDRGREREFPHFCEGRAFAHPGRI